MAVDKLALIKEVRERTNGGMVDVKKALEASDWDAEKAITWLKSNGKIKAAKKSGRVSAEGLVSIFGDHNRALIVELNCETDFVVKNEKFKAALDLIAKALFDAKVKNDADVSNVLVNKEPLHEFVDNLTATIGEKISFRRFNIVEAHAGEILGSYVHINGQVGAIVKVKGNHAESARNVAMHLSAMKPEFIFVNDVPQARIETFKAEFVKPAGFENKPAAIQERILQGSLDKKLSEVVLVKQPFMIDDSVSIEKYLANHQSTLVEAVRYSVGEGIEKVVSDFASEVAAQMGNK
ncbi:translation elongation factor Ts [Mycoplasmopsis columbinasalis]|uniref:Elongation factor Ts n=1 Tax=Mycoplasmopsis columbinasalis TaxID=114880 RepID=A0A449B9I6_9BACT|nr:translation elongation factor Ts [Mycoplasmopsis columbinasalis]VEU77823.1 Elongation factor Ts [Mycoplasmopsis columbinasalis]